MSNVHPGIAQDTRHPAFRRLWNSRVLQSCGRSAPEATHIKPRWQHGGSAAAARPQRSGTPRTAHHGSFGRTRRRTRSTTITNPQKAALPMHGGRRYLTPAKATLDDAPPASAGCCACPPQPRTVDDGLHMHSGQGRHRELRTCHQGPPIHGRLHSLGTRKSYRLLGLKPGFPTAFSGHAEILIGHPIDGLGGFPKRHGPSPGIHPRNAAVLGILNDSHNQSSNAEMPNERGYKDSHG